MSVLIGHASIDENKKVSGGKAGDQTGREVCTRTWYSSTWHTVLRCKDSSKASAMALACEQACANNNIGYNQSKRNTLRTQAQKVNYDLSKIVTPCECDCSSLMTVCAECAGILVPYSGSNAPTTATMKNAFTRTGMFEVITDSRYLKGDSYLKRGDILIKNGHTAMVLGNGTANTQTTSYKIGSTYTLTSDLYIREEPYGEKMKFSCITTNAQKNAMFDDYGCAVLKCGTRVTCKDVRLLTDSIWLLIPSGWICAKNSTKTFVK